MPMYAGTTRGNHLAPLSNFLSTSGHTAATYRIRHVVTGGALTGVAFVYGNVQRLSNRMQPGPETITVRASVELSNGTIVPLLNSTGGRDVTIAPGAYATLTSASTNIADGAVIYSRTYVSGARWPLGLTSYPEQGEGSNTGTSAADLTTSGTVPTSFAHSYSPMAIIGNRASSAKRPLALVGDSIITGQGDSPNDTGWATRALATAGHPWVRVSVPGEKAQDFAAAPTLRSPILAYGQASLVNYGRNDLGAGRTLSQIQVDLLTTWEEVAKVGLVAQGTITPQATSTDSFATTGGQTATGNNSVRVALNTWLRAGAPVDANGLAVAAGTPGAVVAGASGHPLKVVIELADAVESARNSGLWKPNYTADGLHPLPIGHQAMAAAVDITPLLATAATPPPSGTGAPALSTTFFRVRSNSTRVEEGSGLLMTAVAGGANADIDSSVNIVGAFTPVNPGEVRVLSCDFTTRGVTGSRTGQVAVEFIDGTGDPNTGFGGAPISGATINATGTLSAGVRRTLTTGEKTVPTGAKWARYIIRLENNTTYPVAAGDAVLLQSLTFNATSGVAGPPVLTTTGGGSVAAGSSQTFSASVSDGTAPYTITAVQTFGPARTLTRSGNSWTCTTPRTSGGTTLGFRIGVTDSSNPAGAATKDITYTVAADPTVVDSGGSGESWPSWLPTSLRATARVAQIVAPSATSTPGDGGGSTGSGSAAVTRSTMVYGVDKPTDALAGVPAGTVLTAGPTSTVFIDTPGTIYDAMDFTTRVVVRAADVTIMRSMAQGAGAVPTSDAAIIDATHANAVRCRVVDSTLRAQAPSMWLSGVLGHDITLERCIVELIVDGGSSYNLNVSGYTTTDVPSGVKVLGSIVRKPVLWTVPSSRHSDLVSHNDGWQAQAGGQGQFIGNLVQATATTEAGDQDIDPHGQRRTLSCFLFSNLGPSNDWVIEGNWFEGGKFGIEAAGATKTTRGVIRGNRFKGDQVVRINLSEAQRAGFTVTGNVDYAGQPVAATYQ